MRVAWGRTWKPALSMWDSRSGTLWSSTGQHPEGWGDAVGSKVQGSKAGEGLSRKIVNLGLTTTEHLNLARCSKDQCRGSLEFPHKGNTQGRPCPGLTHTLGRAHRPYGFEQVTTSLGPQFLHLQNGTITEPTSGD